MCDLSFMNLWLNMKLKHIYMAFDIKLVSAMWLPNLVEIVRKVNDPREAIQIMETGRLRGLAVACWTTAHYHPCSNPGVGHIWRLFRLWLRLITFGSRSAHLAYHVHKSGRKTSIIINHHQIMETKISESSGCLNHERLETTNKCVHKRKSRSLNLRKPTLNILRDLPYLSSHSFAPLSFLKTVWLVFRTMLRFARQPLLTSLQLLTTETVGLRKLTLNLPYFTKVSLIILSKVRSDSAEFIHQKHPCPDQGFILLWINVDTISHFGLWWR